MYEPQSTAAARKILAWLEAHPAEAEKAEDIDTHIGPTISFRDIGPLRTLFPGRPVRVVADQVVVIEGGLRFTAPIPRQPREITL